MLARIALVCLIVTAAPADAGHAIEIHASCAAEIDPTHVRTLRSALARALEGTTQPAARVVDIALVKLDTQVADGEVVAHAEARAFVSEPDGHIKWATSARATARGSIEDRALVQRDAVSAAAQTIGRAIQARK